MQQTVCARYDLGRGVFIILFSGGLRIFPGSTAAFATVPDFCPISVF
jgi:hypothetical protein